MKAKEMFLEHNAKNPGVIYLRKFFQIFGELYTGLLKYFHGKFKFFNMKKHYNILCPIPLLHFDSLSQCISRRFLH